MIYIVFAITVTLLIAGLLVGGYFLYLFRNDQLRMRKVLLALLTEMRVNKERIDLQSQVIDSLKRDIYIHDAAADDGSIINEAISMARQGASVDQLEMALKIEQSEAAIIVSNHGNLSTEERDRVNQLYMV